MATERRERNGLLDGVRVDVVRLHETWMELLFPRQRGTHHSVLGKWTPTSTAGKVKYRLWSALGALLVAVLYPMMLVGLAARFHARRFDSAATRIGLLGVALVFVLLWGGLTLLARIRFDVTGFYAVAAASAVALVAAVLAVTFTTVGGRTTTVALAYPAGMTALFLPPVVAAFYSPTLGAYVFTGSENIADGVLDVLAQFSSLDRYIYRNLELEGIYYVVLWFGIAVPLGWLLGILVTLADVARPQGVGRAGGSGTDGEGDADELG
jgi:hypothetical protein